MTAVVFKRVFLATSTNKRESVLGFTQARAGARYGSRSFRVQGTMNCRVVDEPQLLSVPSAFRSKVNMADYFLGLSRYRDRGQTSEVVTILSTCVRRPNPSRLLSSSTSSCFLLLLCSTHHKCISIHVTFKFYHLS